MRGMAGEHPAAEFLRAQASKARHFAERLGREDAALLRAYADECEHQLAALVAACNEKGFARAA